jgi:hypothetical protein
MGEKRKAYRNLMGNLEGTRKLGRPKHRWMDDIKMNLGKLDSGGTDCIDLF